MALPTFPVCEEPLTLTKVNNIIANTAKIFSSGNPNESSIILVEIKR